MAQFSGPVDPSLLNLYDSASGSLGPADVTLAGAGTGPVPGSIVLSQSNHQLTFVAGGGLLAADTYTVTFRSAADGFGEPGGDLLDGNGDGVVGDSYSATFAIADRPAGTVTVSVPDMARGAGQPVNVPNSAAGLPIRISDAVGVTSLAVDLRYDPALLSITGATLASGIPTDWSVGLDTSTPGVARVAASGTPLPAGTNLDLVRLTAAVPEGAPYGAVQAIRLENISVNSGGIAAVGDVAVHKAVYLGDADGSGIHSSADAFLTVQAALGLASGFAAHAWTDPRIVGDADGSGVLSAADAFLIVQEGLGLDEPFVPDNPDIGVTQVGGGVDPQFRIDVNLPAIAGGWVSVPVKLAIEPEATNVGALDFDLYFDPARLTIQLPGGVFAGVGTAGWAVAARLATPGQLRVGMVSSNGQPLAVGLREIARLRFHVETAESSRIGFQAVPGGSEIQRVSDGSEIHPTWLDIEPVDPRAGGYTWTDADGSVLIRPAERAPTGAAPERVWRELDAKADLLEDVLGDLTHEIASAWR